MEQQIIRHRAGTVTTSATLAYTATRQTFYQHFIENLLFYILTTLFYRETKNLYITLARHNELPEDDILNVETCRSMLFVIIVFDIIVQTLVRL